MKSNYSGLWLLLTVSLILVGVFSISEWDLNIFGHTLKKAPMDSLFIKEQKNFLSAVADSANFNAGRDVCLVDKTHETDSTSKSILIFGDSMTYNLALRLAQYAKQNGHSFHSVNWDSSNTKIWAESDTLDYFIRKYNVDFLFISLGSNELYFKKPEGRLPYVRKILSIIGDRPYIWIGPPNWKEDTGINDMLEGVCRPGTFFRSAGMEFKRKKDHIHPTRQSSSLWMDSVMRWMPFSDHPILCDMPNDSIGKINPNIVFLKALNK